MMSMRKALCIFVGIVCLAMFVPLATGQGAPAAVLVQGKLTEPDATPFHLQAVVTENVDPNVHVDVEMFWVAPDKWRRTIKSDEFSQTLIVNGEKTFEQDSDDYFPLGIRVLATALVDPTDVVNALRPGDLVRTKANGKADESGKRCAPSGGACIVDSPYGLLEWVGAAGHQVDFTDYQVFKGKRMARQLRYLIEIGDFLQAKVTTLEELKNEDESLFAVPEPTPREKQNRTVILTEPELRALAAQPMDIIWPQILDDPRTTGDARYYVSVDRSGNVREVFPRRVSFKEADDSVRRQIMKWKFKTPVKDGMPVQVEALMDLTYETRAYGPSSLLTDEQARKLASNIVEPIFPPGTKSGSTCAVRIAVDQDGNVIQRHGGDCAPGLFESCSNAMDKWHFSPILDNGKQLPYRAEILFRAP